MELDLREMIGNWIILNSPRPNHELKFDCLFLAIFQSFYWFVSFILQISPPK